MSLYTYYENLQHSLMIVCMEMIKPNGYIADNINLYFFSLIFNCFISSSLS